MKRPHKKARKLTINDETWWWLKTNTRNVVIWSPMGEKTVHLKEGVGFDIEQAKGCCDHPWCDYSSHEVAVVKPGHVRAYIDANLR